MRRRPHPLVLLVVPLVFGGLLTNPAGTVNHGRDSHNVHVTRGRMAVEGSVAAARIRFFRHDLEAAVSAFHHLEAFSIEHAVQSDSLFLSYFTTHFSLEVAGQSLPAEIVSSGEDKDVWWFQLEFQHDSAIDSLTIHNELFFELFSNQKHFLNVAFFPSSNVQALYFVKGATTYSVWRQAD